MSIYISKENPRAKNYKHVSLSVGIYIKKVPLYIFLKNSYLKPYIYTRRVLSVHHKLLEKNSPYNKTLVSITIFFVPKSDCRKRKCLTGQNSVWVLVMTPTPKRREFCSSTYVGFFPLRDGERCSLRFRWFLPSLSPVKSFFSANYLEHFYKCE